MRKLFRLKHAYFYMVLVAVLLLSCNQTEEKTSYIEQEVRDAQYSLETNLVTYVWYKNEIVKAWYDDIDTVNDSLVLVRKEQANKLLEALKNCN